MEPTTVNVSVSTSPGNELSEKGVSTIDLAKSTPASSLHTKKKLPKGSFSKPRMEIRWKDLSDVKYFTHGGSSWVYSAIYNTNNVVVKTLKPNCRDDRNAVMDFETEVDVHSMLNHNNIVELLGTGLTSEGNRFLVLESLTGGTLSQMLRSNNRNGNKGFGRFWRKKKEMSSFYLLKSARSLAAALQYMHEQAVPNCMLLHRDLKPDNICFAQDGTVKLLDFGFARILENTNSKSQEAYDLTGETGSLRYMAPEVAKGQPYSHKVDVYSFGIILWEMNAGKTPFCGLCNNREDFFKFVVERGFRPPLDDKVGPPELRSLISDCWNADMGKRPDFQQVVHRLDTILSYAEEVARG